MKVDLEKHLKNIKDNDDIEIDIIERSKQIYDILLAHGYETDSNPFEKYYWKIYVADEYVSLSLFLYSFKIPKKLYEDYSGAEFEMMVLEYYNSGELKT